MYKILWVSPNSLHDLASDTVTQSRSIIDFLIAMGIKVGVLCMPIFKQPRNEYIDPVVFNQSSSGQNSFTVDQVQYFYTNAASTNLLKLKSREQRSFFGVFCKTVKEFKPDAIICNSSDILSSNILLEAKQCHIPSIFMLQEPPTSSFDMSLADLVLSTSQRLSQQCSEERGQATISIGPWTFDPLPYKGVEAQRSSQVHALNTDSLDSSIDTVNDATLARDMKTAQTTGEVKTTGCSKSDSCDNTRESSEATACAESAAGAESTEGAHSNEGSESNTNSTAPELSGTSQGRLLRSAGPLLQALQELNQAALQQKYDIKTYHSKLDELEQQVLTGKFIASSQTETESSFAYEVVVPKSDLINSLSLIIRLVILAPEDEFLKQVRFILHEDYDQQLQQCYEHVMKVTTHFIKSSPDYLELDPKLAEICELSFNDFISLPQVKLIKGIDQLNASLKTADIYLDLALSSSLIDMGMSKALGYGVSIVTTELSPYSPHEPLDAGIHVLNLGPNYLEKPILLAQHSDVSPCIELLKTILQSSKVQRMANCFKTLKQCNSLEQGLRCYMAIEPLLKLKASLNPHLWSNSIYDVDKILNKQKTS